LGQRKTKFGQKNAGSVGGGERKKQGRQKRGDNNLGKKLGQGRQ